MAKSARDTASPPEGPASEKPVAPIKPIPEKSPAPPEPLLVLEQLDPLAGLFVRINGVSYDLANRDSWGLKQRLHVKRLAERCEALEGTEDPTADDEAEYLQRLRGLAQAALPDLPEEVVEKLQPGQLSDIWMTFLGCQLRSGKAGPLMMLMKRAGVV